jgi:formylglycine-generating enzyme required for sulfatase activity
MTPIRRRNKPARWLSLTTLALALSLSAAADKADRKRAEPGNAASENASLLGIRDARSFQFVDDILGPDGATIQAEFEIEGLDLRLEPTIYLGDTPGTLDVQQVSARATKVRATFTLRNLDPGTLDLRIEQGTHKHILVAAVRLLRRPRIDGTPCAPAGKLEWLPGQTVDLLAPGLSARETENLRVLFAGKELRLAGRERGVLRFEVPAEPWPEAELRVEATLPGFGLVSLCEAKVSIAQGGCRIESVALRFDGGSGSVEAALRGEKLPEGFRGTLTVAGQEPPLAVDFEPKDGAGGERTYLSARELRPDLDRFSSFEISVAGRKLHQESGKWTTRGGGLWTWRRFASELEADLTTIYEERNQGRIRLGRHDLALARIPKRDYLVGLSEEQGRDPQLVQYNLAGPSSNRGGPPLRMRLLRPFLMGVHEVTNAQYLAYLREASPAASEIPPGLKSAVDGDLPREKADLPVTGVSFLAARGYAGWLQGELARHTSRWRVRLPYEVEWEMAARGGEAVSYAFKDDDRDGGLTSLAAAGPRQVGSNSWDQSRLGVRDMTGNVREWTLSVYQEKLLPVLAFHLDSGNLAGWDPARPDPAVFEPLPEDLSRISKNLVVRGGANGEEPALLLLSLRRQLEMSTPDAEVGFRLVLVPQPEE